MLAQNFMNAKKLGLWEVDREALIKTLAMMERGELIHVKENENGWFFGTKNNEINKQFNMGHWLAENECGTIACIGGTARLLGAKGFYVNPTKELDDLFMPSELEMDWCDITVEQAAYALRNYLTTGEANWLSVKGVY